jgi:uncharacterized damage-inducible protein DinB
MEMMNAQEFLGAYGWESQSTANVLAALTDASLAQDKAPGHNTTAGDIAWHIATAPVYMLNQVGFTIDAVPPAKPEHLTAALITNAQAAINAQVKEQVAAKTAEDLAKVYHVFGMMDWSAGQMLGIMMHHEIHHRGQLSILMRQAGLVVPSIYGPTHEVTVEKMKEQQASS